MATIIYLHGFGSIGESPKSLALKSSFPDHTVLFPDLPVDPLEMLDTVLPLYYRAKSSPVLFVGTSLGGFWAAYFAELLGEIGIIVNPSATPSVGMQARVGAEVKNYKTGEPIVITDEIVDRYKHAEDLLFSKYTGDRIYSFFAKNDNVLDCYETMKKFRTFKSCSVFESGGHRFDLYWPVVISDIAKILENLTHYVYKYK